MKVISKDIRTECLRGGAALGQGDCRGGKLGQRPVRRLSTIKRFMITDSARVDPIAAAKNLPPDSGIILRDYDLSFGERLELGLQLKKICRQKNIPLLVAKDLKLALALNADGMHFPELMLADARRMKFKKADWLVTIAAHSKIAVLKAYNSNLDAVLISPVLKTASHPHKKPIGIHRASLFICRGLPSYALGGISFIHKKQLKDKGFCGFAGIDWAAVCV